MDNEADSVETALRLTIVVVGPLPPPSGGMANQTRQLVRLLSEEGYPVSLVRTNAPYRPAFIGRIRGVRALFRLLPYLVRLWRAAGRADLLHVMANSGWAWHLSAAPAVWIGWWRRVPVVVNYRGGEAAEFFARQFRWVRPTLGRTTAVMVPSGFLEQVFAKHGVRTVVVPNVVNLESFRPAPAPPARTTPHIIVTRNLERIYDNESVVRAFATVTSTYPEARLTIAGSGPERGALERLAAELGVADRVRFTGRLDNTELPDLYRSATIMVNASVVDNMPNSVLEAMASGVPIVTTDVGGVPYIVKHESTALLVPPRAPAAIADAVLRLLADPALGRRVADAALEEARLYAWASVRPRLLGLYAVASQERSKSTGSRRS